MVHRKPTVLTNLVSMPPSGRPNAMQTWRRSLMRLPTINVCPAHTHTYTLYRDDTADVMLHLDVVSNNKNLAQSSISATTSDNGLKRALDTEQAADNERSVKRKLSPEPAPE